jgi:hypothetical protein
MNKNDLTRYDANPLILAKLRWPSREGEDVLRLNLSSLDDVSRVISMLPDVV